MSVEAGPLMDEWNKDNKGVVLKELTTYRVVDGVLHKEVVTRRYRKDGDYHDVKQVTPLV